MKIKTSFAIVLFFIVLLFTSMSMKAFIVDNGIITKIATPFRPIAEKLLETCNFPVFLPAYLPSPPDQRMEWLLNLDNLDVSKNKFGIEIDQGRPGSKAGIYAGTLSGNIGAPPESPLEKQIISESREVKNINLPNGIEGKEYVSNDPAADMAISWEIGQWTYFVVVQQNNEGSTIKYASQIINTIGGNGLALSGLPGKLYFFDVGASHPTTEIYWKVNDSVWYQLAWRDDPSNAIKILRSMNYIDKMDVYK